jgi:hypothetical protein
MKTSRATELHLEGLVVINEAKCCLFYDDETIHSTPLSREEIAQFREFYETQKKLHKLDSVECEQQVKKMATINLRRHPIICRRN